MDWLAAGGLLLAGGTAAVSVWKVRRLKREVYHFADQIERGLDEIISGKGFQESTYKRQQGSPAEASNLPGQ